MRGRKIRKIRESLGMTIGEFAKRLGYSWSQLQRIEKEYINPTRRLELLILAKGWEHKETQEVKYGNHKDRKTRVQRTR